MVEFEKEGKEYIKHFLRSSRFEYQFCGEKSNKRLKHSESLHCRLG
jgi:hypothetical protein